MKAGSSASPPYPAFDCVVCGAQLDPMHMDTDREGLRCSFCGSPQVRTAKTPDLKLVPPDDWTPDVGEALRSARQARGETLEQAAHFTRIRLTYLKDLETGDITSFETYPGRIYARFFLREYADHLGLDPHPLVRRFDRDGEPVVQPAPPIRYSRRTPRPGRWAAVAVALLLAIPIAGAIVSKEREQPIAPLASSEGVAPPVLTRGKAHPLATPTIGPKGIRALIDVSLACWIRAVVDGEIVMAETVPAGETVRLRAGDTLDLRFGNAGGVAVSLNGRPIPTGGAGSVLDLSFVLRDGRIVVA